MWLLKSGAGLAVGLREMVQATAGAGGVQPRLRAPVVHEQVQNQVHERFAATVAIRGRFVLSRPVHVMGESFDDASLCVRAPVKLPRGSRITVSFEAPKSMTTSHEGMRCRFPATVVEAREAQSKTSGFELLLKWEKPVSQLVADAASSRDTLLGVLLFAFLAAIIWSERANFTDFWYDPLLNLYAITIGGYFFSRFFFTLFHRPPVDTGYQPTVSVVISARNEREGIAECVRSCYESDYPAEKREVIVVDDGSTDGTADALLELKKKYPELKTFNIPPSGKRFAMAKGIKAAVHEIVVVLDSDTILERRALHHIVCGFEDRTLGGVSGFTAVANADKNTLTRMQDVRYLVSYELMKAPESLFGAVTCCPGCLSAYRKEYLLNILDPWLKQTFLGARATFGDDRSLTNYILRDYRVIYNPLARSSTQVPETWIHYMRQQCRWKKSWLREAPIAGRILMRKNPIAALSFFASAICSFTSPYMVARYMFGGRGLAGYMEWMLLLGLLMIFFAIWRRPTKYWYVAWVWLFSQIFLMAPQTYYALLTMRKNHWGTR